MVNQELDDAEGVVCYPRYSKFLSIINTLALIYLIVVLLLSVCWLSTHYVKPINGASMQPGINNNDEATGDIALVSTTATMKRGDIVIIDVSSLSPERGLLIKRVIAMSGDKLKITNNYGYINIYVNDELLVEDYIKDPYNQGVSTFENIFNQVGWYTKVTVHQDTDGTSYIIIPDGYFFFMGDNRGVSFDSRSMGPVAYSLCEGVVETIFPKGSFMNNFLNSLF